MVQVARAVTGAVFLTLFAGFELHIPAIVNLLPGSYAGLPYTGYIGFGFLLTGLTSLASAFSGPPSASYRGMPPAAVGSPSMPDAATMAAAMIAVQQAQQLQASGAGSAPVACPSCGKPNPSAAKFCQECAAPLRSPTPSAAQKP